MCRKKNLLFILFFFKCFVVNAQKISFTEYDLPNGLHVILHEDHSVPVIAVSVMYHVGSKNESAGRTGFAHFFEHLLFEGSENIKRGQFDKIVTASGGQANANTTQDRTFYYEVLPSNALNTGLWLESERMMHPVINQIGVNTQREVVKEEKRQNFDNRPYGNYSNVISAKLFTDHPYHNSPIGSMKDIDAASLDEFNHFFKKFYVPNNAVLTVSGDLEVVGAKELIAAYFGPIARSGEVIYRKVEEEPITKQMIDTAYDSNIQAPAIFEVYRVPGLDTRSAKVMEMIAAVLSSGASSRLYRKMVDEKKEALQIVARNYSLEDYGMYMVGGIPNGNVPLPVMLGDVDNEIQKLQTELISPEEFEKLHNKFENNYLNTNNTMIGICESLSNGYIFNHKNTGQVNENLKLIRSVTREDIRDAARVYLNKNQRLIMYYLPQKNKLNN